jgi:trigger factor
MLPDFEKALYGVTAGEEKSFKVKFPKDYHAADLASKKVDFAIKVHRVEEEKLPPMDDSLAELYGVEEGGLEQLRADVVSNMEREAQEKVKADIKEQVMNALLELNPIDIPNSLTHQEMHSRQHDAMRRMGIDDHDKAPPIENFRAGAERSVRLGLLMRQLIDDKGITVDPDRVKRKVEEICSGYEQADEMVASYLGNPQVMTQIEPIVLEEQAVDWLVEQGKVRTRKVGFKEYMKAEL